MSKKSLILALLAAFVGPLAAAEAPGAAAAAVMATAEPVEDPAFPTEELLKPRVKFWKQVFAEWSEHSSALHVKDDVSKVFRVLDFRADAAVLSPNELAAKKSREEKAARIEIDATLPIHRVPGRVIRHKVEHDIDRADRAGVVIGFLHEGLKLAHRGAFRVGAAEPGIHREEVFCRIRAARLIRRIARAIATEGFATIPRWRMNRLKPQPVRPQRLEVV